MKKTALILLLCVLASLLAFQNYKPTTNTKVNFQKQSSVTTPSSGFATLWVDSSNNIKLTDSGATVHTLFDSTNHTDVSSLNSLTGSLSIATGTSGSDFNVGASGSTITLNLPTGSALNRGLISTTDWSTFNAKATTVANTFTGLQTIQFNGIDSTFTKGLLLTNDFATDGPGTNEMSPGLSFRGHAAVGASDVQREIAVYYDPSGANFNLSKLYFIGGNNGTLSSSIANLSGNGTFDVTTGFTIGSAAASGHYLRGNGSVYVDGTIQSGDLPDLSGTYSTKTAGGDLSGTLPSPTVAKINGATLGTTTATSGNILIGSGSQWATQAISGDITIGSTGVTAIGSSKVTNTMLAGSIASSKLVGTDIATVGTITSGTWNGTVIDPTYGGTGVNNGSKTITLANNLTTSGNFGLTLTATATTNATLPAGTKTLVATDVATLSSLASIGTITTGVWNGTAIVPQYGGTGLSSLTAYAVICGGTTSTGNLQQVSGVGTANQVLTSNGAGQLPTWQTASAGTPNTVSLNDATQSTPSLYFTNSTGTGWFRHTSISAHTVGVVSNGQFVGYWNQFYFNLSASLQINSASTYPAFDVTAPTNAGFIGRCTNSTSGNVVFEAHSDRVYIINGSAASPGLVGATSATTTGLYWTTTPAIGFSVSAASVGTWDATNLTVSTDIKFAGTNTTGSGSALLGANCPAVTATAPYTWIRAKSSDGSQVYIPCWK